MENHVSHLPIALDGSCNGIQHFSAMLRDPVGGAAVNLVPSDKPSDIYGKVAERTVEKLKELAEAGQPESWIADAWVRFGINRKITKRPVMVLPYGGTFRSCSEYVKEAVKERIEGGADNPFGDDLPKACTLLAQTVWASIGDVVIAARAAMSWLQQCARVCVAAGKPIRWTTPSGFVVVQDYRKLSQARIETRFNGSILNLSSVELSDQVDTSKQASAVSPNFVHSLDASALVRTICRGLDEGITSWAMIHDSYGTHAADTDKLSTVLREEFVKMYREHDVLREFRDSLAAQLPPEFAEKLPPLPESGTLDIELVTKSPYFFA
jgi:DNA-directed RNA polymerase